jgi:hypothetical protein
MKSHSIRSHQRAGSALVITLLFMVLIAVLTVGFLVSMRTEVAVSRSHLAGKRAELLAEFGSEMARARLREATTSTNRAWATQPGRIFRTGENFAPPLETVDLSSGPALPDADADIAADLNPPTLDDPASRLVVPANVPMRVNWVYVREDGTLSSATVPGFSQTNPVVGRFAFWVDDESAKINLNTAGKRDTARPQAHPSQVNLAVLFPAPSTAPDEIMVWRSGTRAFRTLAEASAVSSEVAQAVAAESFSLTGFSHSPERNLFNEPRVLLTTQKNIAGDSDFLDILVADNTDPGILANLSPAKVATQVNRIAAMLRRTDWPYRPGASLAAKFAPVRAEQIALNILEYVRSRESAEPLVEPIRGDLTRPGNSFAWQAAPNGPSAMIGNVRGLRATEVGVWVADSATTIAGETKVDAKFILEVHLPRQGGLDSVDLTTLSLLPLVGIGKTAAPQDMGNKPITAAEISGGGPLIQAGEFRTITRSLRLNTTLRPNVSGLALRFAFGKTGGAARLEVVTQKHIDASSWLTYDIDPAGTAESAIRSFAVEDPMVNKIKENWTLGTNTFGSSNPSALGMPSSASPQQDTDGAGLITAAGVRMPSPKGTVASATDQMLNPHGLLGSVGELGFVHTGVECATAAGIPWRTLRLQPQKSVSDLPDWVLLDLFSVPRRINEGTVPSFFEQPKEDATGGTINLNTQIPTFEDGAGGLLVSRSLPLAALLRGASSISDALVDQLADNIATHVPAIGMNAGQTYGLAGAYLSRGELCEIDGLASSGEAGEDRIRDVIDHAATRGSVFSVFAIGQSLRQLPSGRIDVVGERRTHELVEDPGDGSSWRSVSFRVVGR